HIGGADHHAVGRSRIVTETLERALGIAEDQDPIAAALQLFPQQILQLHPTFDNHHRLAQPFLSRFGIQHYHLVTDDFLFDLPRLQPRQHRLNLSQHRPRSGVAFFRIELQGPIADGAYRRRQVGHQRTDRRDRGKAGNIQAGNAIACLAPRRLAGNDMLHDHPDKKDVAAGIAA
ncbi:MAG: hypothetical protein ACK56I_14480, partial [bacterium]